jgi:hypothetical protein
MAQNVMNDVKLQRVLEIPHCVRNDTLFLEGVGGQKRFAVANLL